MSNETFTPMHLLCNAQARTLHRLRENGEHLLVAASQIAFQTTRDALEHRTSLAAIRRKTLAAVTTMLTAVSPLSGCALIQSDWHSSNARNVQLVVSGVIALDTAQTVQFSRSPECARELNPLAFGGDSHPSPTKVILYNIPYAIGHWFLGKWVDDKWAGRWQQRLYWSFSLGGHGVAIGNNFSEGISPIRKYECN